MVYSNNDKEHERIEVVYSIPIITYDINWTGFYCIHFFNRFIGKI